MVGLELRESGIITYNSPLAHLEPLGKCMQKTRREWFVSLFHLRGSVHEFSATAGVSIFGSAQALRKPQLI